MPADVPIQGVLFTVFQSIFQVFLLCLAGFVLSFKGIVDKPISKSFNHINIVLFTPALLFSKVAFFLSPAKLRQLWVIPIFFTIVTGLSAIIAHWLARALRLKRSQVNFATAASMFMNSNSLPVALMQSLATTVPLLKWGPDDTIDAMFSRSLTYLVVFSTLGMIVRWSYGIRLISQADEPELAASPSTTYRDTDDTEGHPALTHIAIDTTQLVDYEVEATTELHGQTLLGARPLRLRPSHPRLTPASWRHSHRHTHLHSYSPVVPTLLGDQSENEDSDEIETTEVDSETTITLRSEHIDTGFSTEVEDPAPKSTPTPVPLSSSSLSDPIVQPTPRWNPQARSPLLSRIKGLLITLTSLSPPLIASLLAIFCVLIPPVQRLLNSEEMIPLKGALDNAGACSIPLTLIVLGGWFWDGELKQKGQGKHVAEDGIKSGSDDRGHAKSKGKFVEERHHGHINGTGVVPTLLGEEQDRTHTSADGGVPPRLGHSMAMIPYSRDSSTASLSSMIGAVGDALIARMSPRGSYERTRRRAGSNVGARKGDVEPGLLMPHTGMENDGHENGLGRANGRSHLSPISSSSATLPSPEPTSVHTRGTSPPGETLTIFVTLVARMVIVPLIVIPMVILAVRLGWGGEVFEDPVFIVSSMLLVSSPPALTLAQISQRAKNARGARKGPDTSTDADSFSPFERLLSRTVFWAYCVLTPPVTIASVMIGLLSIRA